MKNQGWISIHRKILDNPFCKNDFERLGFWVYLLLKANHSTNKFLHGTTTIECKEGQFVTGRNTIYSETKIPRTTVERWLNFLENDGQIHQHKTNKYRIITIVNWLTYQQEMRGQKMDKKWSENGHQNGHLNAKEDEKKMDIKTDSRWTADGQQMDTNNNDNNVNNVVLPYGNTSDDVSSQQNPVNQIFTAFYEFHKGINFGNKTQRKDADWLISQYGLERVLNVVRFVGKIRGMPYAPRISTPHQLREKWADLETFAMSEKEKRQSKTVTSTNPNL